MFVALLDEKKNAAKITKYSKPLKDINVPTNKAAKAPPTVNILVLIAPKNIIPIINSKIINSNDIFYFYHKIK